MRGNIVYNSVKLFTCSDHVYNTLVVQMNVKAIRYATCTALTGKGTGETNKATYCLLTVRYKTSSSKFCFPNKIGCGFHGSTSTS